MPVQSETVDGKPGDVDRLLPAELILNTSPALPSANQALPEMSMATPAVLPGPVPADQPLDDATPVPLFAISAMFGLLPPTQTLLAASMAMLVVSVVSNCAMPPVTQPDAGVDRLTPVGSSSRTDSASGGPVFGVSLMTQT